MKTLALLCLFLTGCSDALLAPPAEHVSSRARAGHILHGFANPCPGCGGNGLDALSGDDLVARQLMSADQLNAMILWADQHPDACDPANLDGDSDDDGC